LPRDSRPQHLYGCEVWRNLDWLNDNDKFVFNVEAHENLAMALVGVFDSQVCGGKRYDLATMGRRRANATSLIFGIDLTPLVEDEQLDVGEYVDGFIHRFAKEVSSRIAKLS
jgi:hypothetical protein